jgi:hypothetical protein
VCNRLSLTASAAAGAATFEMAPGWSSARVAIAGLMALAAWMPVASADKTAGDYFVHSLPGAPASPNVKMHAG